MLLIMLGNYLGEEWKCKMRDGENCKRWRVKLTKRGISTWSFVWVYATASSDFLFLCFIFSVYFLFHFSLFFVWNNLKINFSKRDTSHLRPWFHWTLNVNSLRPNLIDPPQWREPSIASQLAHFWHRTRAGSSTNSLEGFCGSKGGIVAQILGHTHHYLSEAVTGIIKIMHVQSTPTLT